MKTKEILLNEARVNVKDARETIVQEIHTTEKTIERYKKPNVVDPFVQARLLAHFHERLDQLHHLFPNPFFFRGDVTGLKGKEQTIHFAKFPLIEKGIFSWTSPAARLRFADLGPVSYPLPDNPDWSGMLTRKDQFMIAGGEIRFMTSETPGEGRTLIYQEHIARESGRVAVSRTEGTVTAVDAREITVTDSKDKKHVYKLINFERTNNFTVFHQRPIVSVGDKVKKRSLVS
jgi:hypothetical protein